MCVYVVCEFFVTQIYIFCTITAMYETYGVQTVGRKTSWAKDVWATYFLGNRRLGNKLGRYGDSKSDGCATFFRQLGEMCERGETQKFKTSDTIIRQMCACVIRDKTVCTTLRNTGRKLGILGFGMGKILTLTLRPPWKSIPTKTHYLALKRC